MNAQQKQAMGDRLAHVLDYLRGNPEREYERRKIDAVTRQDFDLASRIRDEQRDAMADWNRRFSGYSIECAKLDLELTIRELRGV